MKHKIFLAPATVIISLVVITIFIGSKKDNAVIPTSILPSKEECNDVASDEKNIAKMIAANVPNDNTFAHKSYSVKMPSTMNFAGEPVPLNDMDSFERMDREMMVNIYWQSQTIYMMKLANRWFPVIEPILKQNGVPDDFKYLALAESGLLNVISPSDAVGVWQILKGTAKDYGLEVNDEIDERYHLEKATDAACKYFLKAYQEFGSWTNAAASYNVGIGRMRETIAYQQTNNYYQLWLNNETARYVFRALAFKEIMSNPALYGFEIPKEDLYTPYNYRTVKVDSSIVDLFTFAQQQNTTYRMLKVLNPWLRNKQLKNENKKEYEIKLPG